MSMNNTSVAIIGAGASGTILANQIIKMASNKSDISVTVYLIEKGTEFGPGLAYSTPLSSHILNMRAETLGVEKDNSLHFMDWLAGQNQFFPDDEDSNKYDENYPPRKIYGQYLKSLLDSTIKNTLTGPCRMELINGEVVDIDHSSSFIKIKMAEGGIITVDNAVLAPGNFPGSFLNELKGIKGYIPYPWPVSAVTENIPRDNPVCIIGSGLSAIDTLFTLQENDHRGKITFISRHGFLPKVQGESYDYKLNYLNRENISNIIEDLSGKTLPFNLIKELYFKEMEAAEGKKIDWLQVFNPHGSIEKILERDISRAETGVIPYQAALSATGAMTGHIWNSLSTADRRIFEKEYKSLWTIYRHPMPLINAKKILNTIKTGQLDILPGCLCVRSCGEKGFQIDISTRFGIRHTIKTPSIINATGQGLDVTKFNDPLIDRLVDKGLIASHPNGGIYVDFNTSEVQGKNGNRVTGLFALGEITRGVHFFTNGIVPNMCNSDKIADYILRGVGD